MNPKTVPDSAVQTIAAQACQPKSQVMCSTNGVTTMKSTAAATICVERQHGRLGARREEPGGRDLRRKPKRARRA